MKKTLLFLLIFCSMFMGFVSLVFAGPIVEVKPLALLDRSGGGGGGSGGAVAIGVGGGAVAAGGAVAFAPLLLAGLSPNSIIAAAAPIDCIACRQCFLQKAIMDHFAIPDIVRATATMNNSCKIYFAQNDSQILNGTFDMQGIVLPNNLLNAKELRVNVTLASDPYNEIKQEPELKLGLYQDIAQGDLRKKFETQQFRRYYLMKRYEVPLLPTLKAYGQGLQKLSASINVSQIKNKTMPLQVSISYTEGGFQPNQAVRNPKVKSYAYLIEFEKVS